MAIRSLMPIAHASLLYGQSGGTFVTWDHNTRTGHSQGHGGSGLKGFTELIFGNECGEYTSADNTSGVKFFPNIKYASTIKAYSKHASTTALVGTPCEAKSLVGDDLNKTGVNGYDPDATILGTLFIIHGDEVNGKFTRIAFDRMAFSTYLGRAFVTFGPSLS
tara:strand:- start:664 stop:1152 length:489 start_codon:yes stop_codon:yes gene_type:complete